MMTVLHSIQKPIILGKSIRTQFPHDYYAESKLLELISCFGNSKVKHKGWIYLRIGLLCKKIVINHLKT